MLRRPFATSKMPHGFVTETLKQVEALLKERDLAERQGVLLEHICQGFGTDVRGYLVHKDDKSYRIGAIYGYSENLRELSPQHGPWTEARARIVGETPKEFFWHNSDEVKTDLTTLELFQAKATMVVPLDVIGEYTVLVLHRHRQAQFSTEELHLAMQWIAIEKETYGLQKEIQVTRRSLFEFARAFVEAAEAQDFSQLGHAERVTNYALELGRNLELTSHQLTDLYLAAMLHDLGKLGSQSWTTEDEVHPQRGANLLASAPLLLGAIPGIRSHHECWDGSGFPDGLKGEQIPLLARIIAIADSFDMLSSERGKGLPLYEVEKELEARANKALDPKLVKTFIAILRQGKTTLELAKVNNTALV